MSSGLRDPNYIPGHLARLAEPLPWTRADRGEEFVPGPFHVPNARFKRLRRLCFHRDSGRCRYCGADLAPVGATLDHVMPRSLGGLDNEENCVTACHPCNRAKRNMTLEESGMTLLPLP